MTSNNQPNRANRQNTAKQERDANKARAMTATVEKLKAGAQASAGIDGSSGVSVKIVEADKLYSLLESDPGLLRDPTILDIVKAGARLAASVSAPSRGSPASKPPLCCCCEKELGLAGPRRPGLFIHFEPIGQQRVAWGNQTMVAIGCAQCTAAGSDLVAEAAMDALIKEPEHVSILKT